MRTLVFILTLTLFSCKKYKVDCAIPDIITPNGDGLNDTWVIDCVTSGTMVVVFDSFENVLYVSENYQNDFNGNEIPNGSYYYRITNNGSSQLGYITILR